MTERTITSRRPGPGPGCTGPGRSVGGLPLACLFAGTFAVGTDGFMITGLLPQIAHDFTSTVAAAAQLVTVFAVIYATGSPVMTWLTARARPRTVLVAALGGLCAANALAALTPALAVLFAARVAAALAASLYMPTAALAAAGLASAGRQGRALSVVTLGLTVSIVTGVPLGALAGDRFGWRATFAGVALLSAIATPAVRLTLPESAPAAAGATTRMRLAALRAHGVCRVLGTTLLGILAGYLAYNYAVPVSQAGGASGNRALAVILACFGAGAACGALLSGIGADRYPQPVVIGAGAAAQAVALAALAVLDTAHAHLGVAPVAAAFTLLGAGSFNYGAPQQRRLIELAPASATTLVSLNGSAIYAGIGLAGAAGGLTLQLGPAANCVAGALIAATTAVLVRRRWQASATAPSRNEREDTPCPAFP
jgi:MFS transporter, DHA1 family, inner membrane transport protein